ncbi:MAG: MBL fold metallo-hydrolase [Deinococcota bacterium]
MVNVSIMSAGYCQQLHSMVFPREAWKLVRFPALFALLEHPREGLMMFDTGYAEHFFTATRRFPTRLYAALLPVTCSAEEAAKAQLHAQGRSSDEVRHIFISHFHADHIAGLRDFPKAEFICSQRSYEAIKDLRGWNATRQAFVPDLLPDDFADRCRLLSGADFKSLDDKAAPFEQGVDLFADGSVLALELEGHAKGQMGLLVKTQTGQVLMAADAVWHSRALREHVLPAALSRLMMADQQAFQDSFDKLERFQCLHPEARIIPSHCAEVYEDMLTSSKERSRATPA